VHSHLSDLADAVMCERLALADLSAWLEIEDLVVRQGDDRHVSRVTRRVGEAFAALRTSSLARAVAGDRAAAALGLPPASTLAELAGAAPEPWRSMLVEHRAAMRTSTRQVSTLVVESREVLAGLPC